MAVTLVRNANRMMTSAELSEDGIELRFADGARGVIPFTEIPEIKERPGAAAIELPNPYELIVETAAGELAEIPWDFARHYCDDSYRPAMEAAAKKGRDSLGERIRRHRVAIGWTQQQLAREACTGRITIVRIEGGEQSPRLKTLQAIAQALSVPVTELLVDRQSIAE